MNSPSRTSIPKVSGIKLLRYVLPLIREPFDTLQMLTEKHGGLIEFNGGRYQQLFFISDAEAAKHILKTNKNNFRRSPVIKALRPLLGNGIFISENEDWKVQHAQFKPAFHEAIIRSYERIVQTEFDKLLSRWKTLNDAIDIEPDVDRTMLSILIKTQFTDKLNLNLDAIRNAHAEVLKNASIKTQKVDFFKSKLGFRTKTSSNDGLNYLQQVAAEIAEFGQKNPDQCGFLLKSLAESKASRDELIDAVLNLIFAGYDTTAAALSWTLYALASHLPEQQNVRDEVGSSKVSFKSISEFNYTRQVIQEAMRLYPPVWALLRQSKEEDVISNVSFEAGSYFMVCTYTMHRDPNVWSHPNKFYPDHFLPENIRGKAFQYIPFGQGERICIGKPLAMMELHYMTALLVQKLRFGATNQEAHMQPGIIAKSKSGIWLEIHSV